MFTKGHTRATLLSVMALAMDKESQFFNGLLKKVFVWLSESWLTSPVLKPQLDELISRGVLGVDPPWPKAVWGARVPVRGENLLRLAAVEADKDWLAEDMWPALDLGEFFGRPTGYLYLRSPDTGHGCHKAWPWDHTAYAAKPSLFSKTEIYSRALWDELAPGRFRNGGGGCRSSEPGRRVRGAS